MVKAALAEAKCQPADLDCIAVTAGPGLAGALLVGLNAAKALAYAWEKPLLGINHLEGHIYANWLEIEKPPELPAVVLIVSGGHSEIVLARDYGDYVLYGRTRDDAAGEAFDKAARVLGLGFPGGPAIERTRPRSRPQAAATAPRLAGRDQRLLLQRPQDRRRPCGCRVRCARGRHRRRASRPPSSTC